MARFYTSLELESFTTGMAQINALLESRKPTVVLAPMMGAVPLIDALNVVNPYFDNSRVYYVPASSSIQSLNNILPGTVANLLKEEFSETLPEELKIVSLDEVVSGSSAIRVRSKVQEGINRYAQIRGLSNEEKEKIQFTQIGLEHGVYRNKTDATPNPEYEKIKASGQLIPVLVDRIITMDTPVFCPVRYVPTRSDASRNTPLIEAQYVVTQEYIQLLAEIASKIGTDPSAVAARNLKRMQDHQQFIPERYRVRN